MKKIDEAVLAILSRVTVEENIIFLTCGQLDRKQYLAVNEILENMGGKWNRKAKGHTFTENPTDKLEQVLLTGEIEPPKKNGYFPTPPEIAMKLVAMADIKPGMNVLEPSAGQGGIADYIPKDCSLDCIELLPDNVSILEKKGYRVLKGDFLTVEPKPLYERIVANPPFSYGGHPQADIDHVLHMWECLTLSGRIVSIMGAGVLFRENAKTIGFRDLINRYGCIERLPENSFKISGTAVNTCIAILDK